MSHLTSNSKSVWAIFGVFFFESSIIGQWIPRIPDIKFNLELSDGELGLALLSMPLGTVLGLAVSSKIIEQLGLRGACRLFLPLWALLFIAPGFATTMGQLMASLVVSGVAIGLIETAMNTEAARLETVSKKRLMSRCHGFWSIGTMVGALLGGLIAQQGVSVAMHFAIVMPLIAMGGYYVASALPVIPTVADSSDRSSNPSTNNSSAAATALDTVGLSVDKALLTSKPTDKSRLITLPSKAILLLCIMPLGVMMVEGAFIDWSAVFMRDIMSASPLTIAITYSFFSVVMAAVRLSGDAISERYQESTIVRFSGMAAMIGIGLFALAPNTLWAFAAAAIAGAGVAIVFPLAVTAAANRPGRSSAENVAALNMIAFSAFLVAPPLIGFLSEWIDLRYALLALVPCALLTVVLAKEVRSSPQIKH